MKPICSKNHFKRLLKSFKRIAIRQINSNPHLSDDELGILNSLMNVPVLEPTFDFLSKKMFESFKKNPYKTHSAYRDELVYHIQNNVWLSYGVEDRYNERMRKNNNLTSGEYFIVFRIYLKTGHSRKKRVAKWYIPITW